MSFQSQIDDILTNNSSDAADELERKLAVYDINDIVAVVAKRAATAGGGGGSPTVLSHTVTITDAQIKAAPSTPVEVVPATEHLGFSGAPTTLPIPLIAMATLDTRGGAYSNLSVGYQPILVWSAGWAFTAAVLTEQGAQEADGGNFDNNPNYRFMWFALASWDGAQFPDGSYDDNGLYFTFRTSDGDLTGGDPGNSLKISTFYVVCTT